MSETSCAIVDSANAVSTTNVPPSNIFQWALLLALALQVPELLKEIRFILDLHYHSFPLLVVLGTVPSLWRRPANNRKLHSESGLLHQTRGSTSGLDLSYDMMAPDVASAATEEEEEVHSGFVVDGDEWGHFADLDESFERNSVVLGRHPKLPTLQETEEEE